MSFSSVSSFNHTHTHTHTNCCVLENVRKMPLYIWWTRRGAVMNLMQQVSDGWLFNLCLRKEKMVAAGICLIKTPDVDSVSPWPLIHNDLHTAAKKPSSPTTWWLSLGKTLFFSLCVLCTALMAWLTDFSSVKWNQLNKISSHLFCPTSLKSSIIC